jgi:hypothetical protein
MTDEQKEIERLWEIICELINEIEEDEIAKLRRAQRRERRERRERGGSEMTDDEKRTVMEPMEEETRSIEEENAIYKWVVFQAYLTSEAKSIRVAPCTKKDMLTNCGRNEKEMQRFVYLQNTRGILIVDDFFDTEKEAREFAEQCWTQKMTVKQNITHWAAQDDAQWTAKVILSLKETIEGKDLLINLLENEIAELSRAQSRGENGS